MARQIEELLASKDKVFRLKGLGRLLGYHDFSLLPQTIKLMAGTDKDVSKLALNVSLLLAKNCVKDRIRVFPKTIIKPAVSLIKKQVPDFVKNTMNQMDDTDSDAVINALIVLKYFINDVLASEVMRKFTKTPDSRIRATLVKHIGPVAVKRTADLLNRFLNDPDERVRANTIEALEQVADKRYARVFTRFKRDPHHRIRANVIRALFNLGERVHYDNLKEMLSAFDNPDMRTSGVWTIGEIGRSDPRCLDLLKLVVDDKNQRLQDNLRRVVDKIGIIPEIEYVRVRLKDAIRKQIKDRIIKTTELKMEEDEKAKYLLIKLSGSLTVDTLLSLKFRLQDLEARNDKEIVLDFTRVEYVDSSGAGLLSNYGKKLDRKGRFLFIFGVTERVKDLFELTGIDYHLKIFPAEKEVRGAIYL